MSELGESDNVEKMQVIGLDLSEFNKNEELDIAANEFDVAQESLGSGEDVGIWDKITGALDKAAEVYDEVIVEGILNFGDTLSELGLTKLMGGGGDMIDAISETRPSTENIGYSEEAQEMYNAFEENMSQSMFEMSGNPITEQDKLFAQFDFNSTKTEHIQEGDILEDDILEDES